MQDFVPLGTGNSRNLKSAIPAGTTWEQALAMLRGGTFPIDIGAVNPSGISQQGNPLNKNTLLKDETAALFGKSNTAVPDEIFQILSKALLINDDGSTASIAGKSPQGIKFQIVSYTGTGKYGESNPCSLTFDFAPDAILFLYSYHTTREEYSLGGVFSPSVMDSKTENTKTLTTAYKVNRGFAVNRLDMNYAKTTSSKNKIYWYNTDRNGFGNQLNDDNQEYTFMAIKFVEGA